MAGSFNRVILLGTLVRDPEIRYVASGKAVTKFRIAVNPNKKDPRPDETLFVDIIAWEKLGETCNTYLKKGSSALVEGRLDIRQYDDKDGNKRQATEIVINTMQMVDRQPRRDSSDGGGEPFGNGSAQRSGFDSEALDDEIPF